MGIAPSGAVSLVLIYLLEEEDSVMVDKGFQIEEDLPQGVSLNIPPFLRVKEHLSIKEEIRPAKLQQFGSMWSVQFHE